MKFKRFSALALTCACVLNTAANAQQPSSPAIVATPKEPIIVAPGVSACCQLAALTPVELEFVEPASSRTSKAGEIVTLRLAEPLMVDGRTIAPVGTKAFAEVIQASRSGLMGKAGELTFAARYIQLNDQRVPLKRFGFGRTQGSDPSGTLQILNVAAAAALPVASVALIFVSGGNVDIKSGARAHAVVATGMSVASNP